MTDPLNSIPRRRFVGSLALAGAALALPGTAVPAQAAATIRDPATWDHSWLKRLKAKHRVFFDSPAWSSDTFAYPTRYRDAMLDGYGAKPDEVQIVIGLSGKSWPVALDDKRWDAYALGTLVNGSTRDSVAKAIEAILKLDAILLVCNNSLRKASIELAASKEGRNAEEVYADLRAGITPHVIVVPAITAAIGMAQEHGCAYMPHDNGRA